MAESPAAASTSAARRTADGTAVGPDTTGAAAYGLCTAWASHQKNGDTAAMESVPMRNLAEAAGGEGKIAAYCAAVPQPGNGPKDPKPGKAKASPGQSQRDKDRDTGKDDDNVPGTTRKPTTKPTAKPTTKPNAKPTTKADREAEGLVLVVADRPGAQDRSTRRDPDEQRTLMLPRQSRRERGAAAVEMAIVLPLLLLIVGGIIDFGRFFYTQNIVVNAAREGARSRAMGYTIADSDIRISQSLTGIQGGANTNSYWLVQGSANTLTASGGVPGDSPGPLDRQRVTVTVTRVHLHRPGARVPALRWALTPPIPAGTSEMRCGG